MIDVVSTTEIRFTKTDAGVLRVGSSRVSLESVIHAFKQGSTAEEIAMDFDSLTLGEVYAVLTYFLQNQDEVEAYLAERLTSDEELRNEVEEKFPVDLLRERLLSRR